MQEREIRTFHDIIRALEEQPSLREQLRVLLLTRDLLDLPRTVAGLAEAISRLERQVERLAQAQERAEERLGRLEERVGRLEERADRLEEALTRLAEAQARTEERVGRLEEAVARLAEAQESTQREVASLARRLAALEGDFRGDYLERRYRDRAYSYFSPILESISRVSPEELWRLVEEAARSGRLSREEARDAALIDVLVEGYLPGGEHAFLAVEVSGVVYPEDVEAALRRRSLLERCLQAPVVGAVAGRAIAEEAEEAAKDKLFRVLDGVAVPPGSPAPPQRIAGRSHG